MDFRVKSVVFLAGILLCNAVIFSCGNEKTNDPVVAVEKNDTAANIPGVSPESKLFDYSNTVLTGNFSDTVFHVFSDTSAPDCFTFFVPAGNINETKATLRIVNHEGRLIYEDVFSTTDLINGYDLGAWVHNEGEMQDYLLKKEKEMLDTSAFVELNPVTDQILLQDFEIEKKREEETTEDKDLPLRNYDHPPNEITASEFENYPVFELAQKENRPLFVYGLNEENIRYIGYSPKLKKAVVVTSCC